MAPILTVPPSVVNPALHTMRKKKKIRELDCPFPFKMSIIFISINKTHLVLHMNYECGCVFVRTIYMYSEYRCIQTYRSSSSFAVLTRISAKHDNTKLISNSVKAFVWRKKDRVTPHCLGKGRIVIFKKETN